VRMEQCLSGTTPSRYRALVRRGLVEARRRRRRREDYRRWERGRSMELWQMDAAYALGVTETGPRGDAVSRVLDRAEAASPSRPSKPSPGNWARPWVL
jgi:hypothetical protein